MHDGALDALVHASTSSWHVLEDIYCAMISGWNKIYVASFLWKIQKMEVTWNRTNFKWLGRVRVQIWETIFAIIVPVGLSSYVFGRRCMVVFLFIFCANLQYISRMTSDIWHYVHIIFSAILFGTSAEILSLRIKRLSNTILVKLKLWELDSI